MTFKLFGGLDCPDTLLARIAVVADLNSSIVAKMTDHVITIMLLLPQNDRSDKGNTFPKSVHSSLSTTTTVGAGTITTSALVHGSVSQSILPTGSNEKQQQRDVRSHEENEVDMQNQLFFARREMVELGGVKVAQALTAIHTIVTNIIKYDVSHNDAVDELIVFGLSEEVVLAIVTSVDAHRSAIAMVLLHQTPLLAFASFALPYGGDRTARGPIVENESTFGVRAFLHNQNGLADRRLFDIQRCEGKRVSLGHQQQEEEKEKEKEKKSESSSERMVVWKLRDGLDIYIPLQKARALLTELVVARETLRAAWRPYEVE